MAPDGSFICLDLNESLMFSSGFIQLRKILAQADKNAKTFFAVRKLIFLTTAIMIGSVNCRSRIVRPIVADLKNQVVQVDYSSTFTFALESRGFIRLSSGVFVILSNVNKREM